MFYAAGSVAEVATIETRRESFTVIPRAHPHLTQLGWMSRPRFVTVTLVGSEEYPWNATTKVSVNTCVFALHPAVGVTTEIVVVIGMKIVVSTRRAVPTLYETVVCGCTVESVQNALHNFSLNTARILNTFAAGATFAPAGERYTAIMI